MATQDENVIGIQGEGHRQSILDAAEELFAEKGFGGTSIREITQRAKCNIASVNYYSPRKTSKFLKFSQFPTGIGLGYDSVANGCGRISLLQERSYLLT